jgi:hypothetical protein
MPVPLALSNLEYECRKVGQPIRVVIPTFPASRVATDYREGLGVGAGHWI